MIMEMVGNRSFTLTTGNGKRSRLRRLKNGVSQGSVLAPFLFNIYISDLPTTVSRKYAYADDLAIMHADQGRIMEGATGQLPRSPLQGGPVMKFICIKKNIRLKNFRDSRAIQEYNSILYSYVPLSIKGPQQQLISLHQLFPNCVPRRTRMPREILRCAAELFGIFENNQFALVAENSVSF